MEERSPLALIMPAPATLHKIHLVLIRLREATHAARSIIIMQGWNGPLGCYLHLSVFPATSNLLMIIKEQRGPAALWKRAPSSREWPCIHNHPELKPLFDKNQEKHAGRLPRTTCKPPSVYTHAGFWMDTANIRRSFKIQGRAGRDLTDGKTRETINLILDQQQLRTKNSKWSKISSAELTRMIFS